MNKLRTLLITLLALFIAANSDARKPVIFMIGDSTMSTKKLDGENPERGWGHVLPGFLTEDIIVDNHAQNGRSSKSFLAEGRWEPVLEKIQPGDFVFIQFGHNDEPGKGDRTTTPGGDFDDNLRKYVNEARQRGAKPLLFTPIVRRIFLNDSTLEDRHKDYTEAIKRVARELSVPCVDMNKLSDEFITNLGPEESKAYYMHVAKGTCAAHPEGKQDDTHLNARGARAMASMAIDAAAAALIELKPYVRHYDFVVAKDGSGDFFTVQEAIDAVPVMRGKNRTTILIREGVYKEKVTIPANRPNIAMIGQGKAVITFDDFANRTNRFGETLGTSGSSSFYVYAPDFYAENITFENTAGNVGQAVACFVAGDRAMFRNCRFLGNQDTLYNYFGRQYFEDCYIEGTVDFIFGKGTALFNRCEIRGKRSKAYYVAPATPQGTEYGYVFYDCDLTADPGVEDYWLARPWRDYGQTVFVRCRIGAHVCPEGWHNWNKKEREATSYFAECQCTGPGADTSRRAFGYVLESADKYLPHKVLLGDDGWCPVTHIPDSVDIKYP